MKKIIPALIFTAAASAATLMYIKKKLSEKNEIELIELDEKQQLENDEEEKDWQTNFDPFVEKVSEVTNTIDTIVDGFKEELSSGSQLFNTGEQTEIPFEESPVEIEIVEITPAQQEENQSEEVAPTDDEVVETFVEIEDPFVNDDVDPINVVITDTGIIEEPIVNENDEPVKFDEDQTETNEEEMTWDETEPQAEQDVTDQTAEIETVPTEEVVEPIKEIELQEVWPEENEETPVEDQIQEEFESQEYEDTPVEEPVQEEIPSQDQVDAEQQRIVDEINDIINGIIEPMDEEEEEITEENVTYTPEQQVNEEQNTSDELEPLEYNEAPLEPLDEEKTAEIVINSIIDSVQEEDQNQQAMDDIEELIEDEVEQVDEEDMTHEELVEKYVHQFETINPRKIDMILTQIDLMRKTVGDCEYITLLHYIRFNSPENKNKYAAIAEVEGYTVEDSENATDLSLVNTLENSRHTLNLSILDLARNANEYNGAYRGWAVRSQE